MVERVTIPLKKPIEGHEGPIRRVVLRAPTFDEYLEIGECWELGQSNGGVRFTIENTEAIRQYLDRCLVEPREADLLKQGGLPLARKVKAAILGFFQDGDEAMAEASKTSPTNSPSVDSASTPAP